MADEPRYRCVAKLRRHTHWARRRRPVKQSVRAVRGAGQFRRGPVERPRRVRFARRHAHGVERVERSARPDAARAHGLGAAPASSRQHSTTTRGAQVMCVAALPNGRVVSGSWDRMLKVWDVSSCRCVRTLRGHTNTARRRRPVDNTRRRRDGRRSCVSPPCRTATSCPGRPTARSWCGTSRPASAARHYAGTWTRHGAGVQSNRAVDRSSTPRGRRSRASPSCRTAASCPGRPTARSWCRTCRPASAARYGAGTRSP